MLANQFDYFGISFQIHSKTVSLIHCFLNNPIDVCGILKRLSIWNENLENALMFICQLMNQLYFFKSTSMYFYLENHFQA